MYKYGIVVLEQMFYNPFHTERKWETESKGKGNFMSDQDRQEFREFLQFCIAGLKAGMSEDDIFTAWKVANDIKLREAG